MLMTKWKRFGAISALVTLLLPLPTLGQPRRGERGYERSNIEEPSRRLGIDRIENEAAVRAAFEGVDVAELGERYKDIRDRGWVDEDVLNDAVVKWLGQDGKVADVDTGAYLHNRSRYDELENFRTNARRSGLRDLHREALFPRPPVDPETAASIKERLGHLSESDWMWLYKAVRISDDVVGKAVGVSGDTVRRKRAATPQPSWYEDAREWDQPTKGKKEK